MCYAVDIQSGEKVIWETHNVSLARVSKIFSLFEYFNTLSWILAEQLESILWVLFFYADNFKILTLWTP